MGHVDENKNKRTILVAVSDIFFYTKIRDALLPQGYVLERARTDEDFSDKISESAPSAVILNMNDDKVNAFEALRRVLGTASGSSIPTLAFANHEEAETWKRAKELGVTKIV